VTEVTLSEVRDFAALGERWRALEERSDPSFFQSWTWTGCLAEERYPDPILAEARDGGDTVGLALFNRRRTLARGVLFLGETGALPWDRLVIEHNGPLTVRDREDDVPDIILDAAAARYDLVLSGMTRAVSGVVLKSQPAPFAYPNATYLDRRSANTRQQIRRSDRAFASFGPLSIARAETEAVAHIWLDEMAALHQATWTARGAPGSFADPFFGRFHHALIGRGVPRHEIDLLRVTAGDRTVGILYNFRFHDRVLAYQSGFAYDGTDARFKPGLTCHRMAIEAAATEGVAVYDFLAGDDRYKRSLADGANTMLWLLAGPWWSLRVLTYRARHAAGRLRDTWSGGQ
jgi:CelD/BcsL family acetyltransferase involved in cellulose biosynthesis